MSISGLCKRVSSFGFTLLEQGYALDAQQHALSVVKGGVRALSWVRDGSTALILPASPRVDDYLKLLQNREYSFLMHDGAAVQVLYQYNGSSLVKHRLLYWPCPFEVERALQDYGQPIADLLETVFLGNTRTETVLRGLIRFDYAPAVAGEFHPASHLTMAHQECRIPIHAPLSFDTFMRFVLENFHPQAWRDGKVRAHFAFKQELTSLRAEENERVHLEWRYC